MNSQCSSALFILVGIVSWADAAEKAERPIELLVRGDDMGHSLDVNLGFIKAHTEGIGTSASLMAPSLYFDDAVTRCKAHPKLAPGIHVTLMATKPMRPILPPDQVSSLIAPNGFFHHGLEDFLKSEPKIDEDGQFSYSGVDQRTNMAMKNSPNKGAASGLTILYDKSSKLPGTMPTKRLKPTTTTPMPTDRTRSNHAWFASCGLGGLRHPSRTKKSTAITEHDELMPAERLDMAAANRPATTSPAGR